MVLTVTSRRLPFIKTSLIFFKKVGITTINAAANAHGYALDLGIAEFWWHLITSIWGKEAGSQENITVCLQKTWYF